MSKKTLPLFISAAFLTLLFIKCPSLTSSCVERGISTCLGAIIPSLFPLMVVSEILCGCGILDYMGKLLGKQGRLLGRSPKSAVSVIAGLLLGFPVGTRMLAGLYDRGEIEKDELERTIGVCGIPSFGFLSGVLGSKAFSSRRFGIFMYFAAILAALTVCGFYQKGCGDSASDHSYIKQRKDSATIVTESLSSAARATLTLCAYIIFFSCISGCISAIIGNVHLGAFASVALELTSGIFSSAALKGKEGLLLCGFAVGWGGLSVHCQTMALLGGRVTNYRHYFIQKLAQAILCAASALAFTTVSLPLADTEIATSLNIASPSPITLCMLAVGIFLHIKAKTPNAKR